MQAGRVCRNGKSTVKQFRPSKQWHEAKQTRSEAELNGRLVFIFGAEKSSKKYVCVLGRCVVCVLGGRSVGRSARGVVPGRLLYSWGRERRAAGARLRGEETGAQLHFPFAEFPQSFLSFLFRFIQQSELVKERESAVERESFF